MSPMWLMCLTCMSMARLVLDSCCDLGLAVCPEEIGASPSRYMGGEQRVWEKSRLRGMKPVTAGVKQEVWKQKESRAISNDLITIFM